jgi:Leucine-rich repeat (LRR) protein
LSHTPTLCCFLQNNCICTLKGSLLRLKFLTDLDLSHNQLRDLRKLLQGLARLRFLQQLNLQVGHQLRSSGFCFVA